MRYFVVRQKIREFQVVKVFATYEEAFSYRRDAELILREVCYGYVRGEPCEDHVEL